MLSNDDETLSVVITTVGDTHHAAAEGGVTEEEMSCRSATFQEVTITLQPPPSYDSVAADRKLVSGRGSPLNLNSPPLTDPEPLTAAGRKWDFVNRVKRLPTMLARMGGARRATHHSQQCVQPADLTARGTGSPGVSKRPSLTPSQINLAAIGLPLFQLRTALSSSGNRKKPKPKPKRHTGGQESPLSDRRGGTGGENSKQVRFQRRIDRWSLAMQTAIHEDMQGNAGEALMLYRKFNVKITRETINFFEQFTGDQQKLLRQIMGALDRRCTRIKSQLSCEPDVTSEENVNEHPTLTDLRQSLGFLSTIKTIGSGKTMPVMLVYQERKHRKKHRDDQKGKSNKIMFAREKRDFLQHMGLPEAMITYQGIDFSVMPLTSTENGPPAGSKMGSRANSHDSFVTALQFPPSQRPPVDGAPSDPSNSLNKNQLELDLNFATVIEEDSKPRSLVDRCLGLRKRFQRSPSTPSLTDYEQNYKPSNTMSVEEWIDNEISKTDPCKKDDSVAMLSCDSCSSSESVESVFEIMDTDSVVRANYRHRAVALPSPERDLDETYVVLAFEKVGLRKTNIQMPFLRVSIRDSEGALICDEQETSCWDVINQHYLRAPSPVFIQESMESLPDDFCLFFEVRHHIPSKRKVCTHSYTFVERSELQNGEFVCEMYKPPVDYTKGQFIPYSEKALFLHLDIKLERDESEPELQPESETDIIEDVEEGEGGEEFEEIEEIKATESFEEIGEVEEDN